MPEDEVSISGKPMGSVVHGFLGGFVDSHLLVGHIASRSAQLENLADACQILKLIAADAIGRFRTSRS